MGRRTRRRRGEGLGLGDGEGSGTVRASEKASVSAWAATAGDETETLAYSVGELLSMPTWPLA